MTLSPIAGALLSEQLELIREIARNLVGEAEPSAARLPTREAQRLPDGRGLGAGGSSGAERAAYGDVADRPGIASPSLSLFGLRPAFAGTAGAVASQGAEIQRLIEILDLNATAVSTVGPMVAAREGTASIGESGRTSPGKADMAPAAKWNDGTIKSRQAGAAADIAANLNGSEANARMATEVAKPPQAGTRFEAPPESTPAASPAAQGRSSQAPILSGKPDALAWTEADPASAANAESGTYAESRTLADLESAIRSAIVGRNSVEPGVGNVSAQVAGVATERAGIVASFILNAHFQPGWPPLRPIQDAKAVALAVQVAQVGKLTPGETEMLVYLANFGVNVQQVARILSLLLRTRHRSKLLAAILGFMVNLSTVVRLLQEELAALLDDLGTESQLLPRTASGKRLRTDLR